MLQEGFTCLPSLHCFHHRPVRWMQSINQYLLASIMQGPGPSPNCQAKWAPTFQLSGSWMLSHHKWNACPCLKVSEIEVSFHKAWEGWLSLPGCPATLPQGLACSGHWSNQPTWQGLCCVLSVSFRWVRFHWQDQVAATSLPMILEAVSLRQVGTKGCVPGDLRSRVQIPVMEYQHSPQD